MKFSSEDAISCMSVREETSAFRFRQRVSFDSELSHHTLENLSFELEDDNYLVPSLLMLDSQFELYRKTKETIGNNIRNSDTAHYTSFTYHNASQESPSSKSRRYPLRALLKEHTTKIKKGIFYEEYHPGEKLKELNSMEVLYVRKHKSDVNKIQKANK